VQYDLTTWEEAKSTNPYKYVLLAVDHFSKYAWARPLKTKNATDVSAQLADILAEAEPDRVISDNGGEFRNAILETLLDERNITKQYIRPYEKKHNGGVERGNRTVAKQVVGAAACRLIS